MKNTPHVASEAASAKAVPCGSHLARGGTNQVIQGLRGVAILLVLLNHMAVPGFSGGFVGVDLFFVISGYLIGGQLLREYLTHGRIDLVFFYARRFLRLLPAAMALLMVVTMGMLLWRAPLEWGEYLSSARAAALYLANIWFASRAVDYFGGHQAANPLLHLWSLAVEEQFYFVWPLLLLAALRVAMGRVLGMQWVTGLLLVVSGLACVYATQVNKHYAFFLTPFRVWEFAAGVLLATWGGAMQAPSRAMAEAIGFLSLLGLAACVTLLGPDSVFPGALAILPVTCGVALLWLAEQRSESSVGHVLGWRPLRRLGDWSYSVYLWHWPVLLLLTALWPQQQGRVTCLGLLISILLGYASFRWIETPFRRHPETRKAAAWVIVQSLLACLVFAVAVTALQRVDLAPSQLKYRAAAAWAEVDATGCLVGFDAREPAGCSFGPHDATRTVVLFGDSHALQWLPALRVASDEQKWRLVVFGKSACPPIDVSVQLVAQHRHYGECDAWRARVLKRLPDMKPDLVVLAASTTYAIDAESWNAGLKSTADQLRMHGAPVLAYLRDTPRPGFNVPICLARAQHVGRRPDEQCVYARDDDAAWSTERASEQAQGLSQMGISLIDMSDYICHRATCSTERDGVVMFSDHDHLAEAFARSLASPLAERLNVLLPPKLQR